MQIVHLYIQKKRKNRKKTVPICENNELFFKGGNNLHNLDYFILNFALIFSDKLILNYAILRFKNTIFYPLSKQRGCPVDGNKSSVS